MTDLVSQLVGALQSFVDDIVPNNQNDPLWEQARAALTAAKAGGWVPIETAPKDGRRVLVAIEGVDRAVVSFWSGAGWATVDGHDWKGRPVTHWQPLPTPPKEQSAWGLGLVDAVADPRSATE